MKRPLTWIALVAAGFVLASCASSGAPPARIEQNSNGYNSNDRPNNSSNGHGGSNHSDDGSCLTCSDEIGDPVN